MRIKLYIYTILLLCSNTLSMNAQAGQCLAGGCNTGVSWGATQSTTSSVFVNSVAGTWGGEYNTYNVTTGQQYEWSLCPTDGATVGTNTDSQLSLRRNDNNGALCYSDDFCGAHAKILWTATFTGVVRVYVHRYNCATVSTGHTVRWRCTSCSVPPTAPCTNSIAFGSATAPVVSGAVTISTCTYQNEYNTINSIVAGRSYTIGSSCGGYITVRRDAFNGTVIGHGAAPFTFTAPTSGTYYIHYNTNSNCGTASNCCTTTIACNSCSVPTPPANDIVCNATAISCGQTLSGTTVNATNSGTGENQTCGTGQAMPGVWYVVSGNGQIMTASLCGTVWDSKISVFNGTNCSALTCVGGIDDNGPACASTSASFSWTSVVGQNYYILVHGFSSNSAFSMSLSCVPACPVPSNNLCANAPILNLGTNNNQTHLGTGCGSTATLGTFKDVWVAFTVPCGGMNVAIDFCGSAPAHTNAYINIFPDCSFTTWTSAANWDFTSCPDGNIRLYWNNVPAGTYYYPILIDPTWETNYTLNISGTPLHTPATAPTSISGTSTICSGQNTTLTLQGGSAGTNGTVQWFEGSCASAVIGTTNSITVAPTTNSTYFVRYTSSCNTTACASVSVNVNTNSFALTSITAPSGTVCPNTNVTLTAAGGTAGSGSDIYWYDAANGAGTLLGTGSSIVVAPTATMTVYARRQGTCNTSADVNANISTKNFVYATNGTNASTYCTDNNGWHNFYNGDDIILSVRGNLSSVSGMVAQISDNGSVYSDPGNPLNCLTGWTSGEAQFEMERNWNVSYTGALSGTYEVRYYFESAERDSVIAAANNFMNNNPSCGYFYKYNPGNDGWFWFKNNNVSYSAPSFDDNPNFALLTLTTPGTTLNGINYTTFDGITSFSGGTGAVVLVPGGFLPVEWLYFNVENQGNTNNLFWATASEENALSFDVERCKDGSNFEKIGTKTAAGNSSVTNYYEFLDNNPQNGFNYYRVKLINTDGTEEYTEIKVIENKFSTDDFTVFPNPTSDIINFNTNSTSTEDIKVEILDILGRVVKSEIHNAVVGKNNLPLNVAELQSGSYSLRATFIQSNRMKTVKFIKK